VSGDDVIIVAESAAVAKLYEMYLYKYYYHESKLPSEYLNYGLGQWAKDYCCSETTFDFLSRLGFWCNVTKKLSLQRLWQRLLTGCQSSFRLTPKLTARVYNHTIDYMLAGYMRDHPTIADYLVQRQHLIPTDVKGVQICIDELLKRVLGDTAKQHLNDQACYDYFEPSVNWMIRNGHGDLLGYRPTIEFSDRISKLDWNEDIFETELCTGCLPTSNLIAGRQSKKIMSASNNAQKNKQRKINRKNNLKLNYDKLSELKTLTKSIHDDLTAIKGHNPTVDEAYDELGKRNFNGNNYTSLLRTKSTNAQLMALVGDKYITSINPNFFTEPLSSRMEWIASVLADDLFDPVTHPIINAGLNAAKLAYPAIGVIESFVEKIIAMLFKNKSSTGTDVTKKEERPRRGRNLYDSDASGNFANHENPYKSSSAPALTPGNYSAMSTYGKSNLGIPSVVSMRSYDTVNGNAIGSWLCAGVKKSKACWPK
jgi:hypothetical protein